MPPAGGAAVLSTALTSNALNVTVGLLLPGALLGLGPRSGTGILVAAWYAGLTMAALVLAYAGRGLRRPEGIMIIVGYLVLAAALLEAVHAGMIRPALAWWPAAAFTAACAALLAARWAATGRWARRETARAGTSSLLPGWPAARVWQVSLVLSLLVAACDAATGRHLILIGLLIIGPCCALLTGRWALTALTGAWSLGLGTLTAVPDGIWGTSEQYAFLTSVALVALVATLSAVVIQRAKART